jgi:P4 family phage/plasmid primase-like protien
MSGPLVTVLPHAKVRGWGGAGPASSWPSVPLVEALRTAHKSDVHLVPYWLEGSDTCPRLNIEILSSPQAGRVRLQSVFFDLDGPGHTFTEAFKADVLTRLGRLPKDLFNGAGWYTTRGGMRLVWALAEPVGPQAWGAYNAGLTRALQAVGMPLDEATLGNQWNRLYRAPFVVREGEVLSSDVELDTLEDEPVTLAMLPPEPAPSKWARINNLSTPGLNLTGEGFATVPEGGRNAALFKMGAMLRAKGFMDVEVEHVLPILNQTRCNPPLPDEDVATLVRQVCRYEAGRALADIAAEVKALVARAAPVAGRDLMESVEETEDGEIRINCLADETILSHIVEAKLKNDPGDPEPICALGNVMAYDEDRGVWVDVPDATISGHLQAMTGKLQALVGHGKDGSPVYKTVPVQAKLVKSVISLLRERRDNGLWSPVPGVATRLGLLRVVDGAVAVVPHSPSHHATFSVPYDVDLEAQPTLWLKSLRQMFEGTPEAEQKIQALGEFLGAALMGDAPRYAKALVLHGAGANGKSVVAETIMQLFPAEAVTSIAPQDLPHEYRKAQLATSRLNVVTEMPDAAILSSEAFKAVVSGDMTSGRHPHGRVFNFRPTAAHLFACNQLPSTADHSAGFWRRWIVLDFKRQFMGPDANPRLRDELEGEHGAIMAWALRCYCQLQARGHYEEIQDGVLQNWRTSSDSVALWIQSSQAVDATTTTHVSVAFGSYKRWAEEHGFRPFNARRFETHLAMLNVPRTGAQQWGLVTRGGGVRLRTV